MIITLRRTVAKRCPYKDETDVGELVITIPTEGWDGPELYHLATVIDDLAAKPASHERFTGEIAARLPGGSSVTTTWQTGPWSVEVREDTQAAPG